MAIDNTPPRLRLIATIAVIVVITLISLDFMLKSYYAIMTDEAQREKIAPTTEAIAQAAAERASFEGAKVPINQAMAQLKTGRSELIEPKPSDDIGAMTGWSKLPRQVPATTAPMHGADLGTHTGVDGGAMDADGGAMMAADGGATTATDGGAPTATDAGAPKGGAAKDAGARAPH